MPNTLREQLLAFDASALRYWRFNEAAGNAADSSGNLLTLTANGGITYSVDGPSGKSVTFNGTTGYFAAATPALPASFGELTIAAWIKGAVVDGQRIICCINGVTLTPEISIRSGYTGFGQTTGQLCLDIVNDAGTRLYGGLAGHAAGTMLNNTWKFVTVVVKAEGGGTFNVRQFIDGALVSNVAGIALTGAFTPTHTTVGRQGTTGTFFAGSVEHVAFLTVAMSDSDVAALFAATKLLKVKPDGSGDFTTLQAWADTVDTTSGQRDCEFYAGGDLGALTISSGWTPNPTRIYPGPGQQHRLSTASGASSTGNISIQPLNVTLEGLRTTGTVTAANGSPTFKNCIFGAPTITFAGPGPISPVFTNCVFIGSLTCTSGVGTTLSPTFNNCFFSVTLGWNPNGGTVNMTASNTMAASFTNAGGAGSITMSNNLSADGTANGFGGTGHLINKALANQVFNTASDWKLKPSADARNAGVTVAAASPDALGRARPIGPAFDIGPHEFAPSSSMNFEMLEP